jgi:hypothetical protein
MGSVVSGIGSAVGNGISAGMLSNAEGQSAAYDMQGANVANTNGSIQNFLNTGSQSQSSASDTNATVQQLLTGGSATPAFGNYLDSTGYNFQLSQGIGAINASAASKGLLDSGGTAKDLMTYGQNLASTTFNNYLNQLNGLSASQQANANTGAGVGGQVINANTTGGVAAGNNNMQGSIAQANANTAMYTGIGNALGGALNGVIGGGATSILGGGGSSMAQSDVRLKEGIRRVGTLANGIGVYSFRYLGDTVRYVGVLAQEVLRKVPDAVVCGRGGYLSVHYGKLGFAMRRA